MEDKYLLETINKIIDLADGKTLDIISDKIKEKQSHIHSIKRKNERLEFIKKYTISLEGINIKDVKQIEKDCWDNVYTLLNNGYLLENGELCDVEIDRLYYFDSLILYAITNDNKIVPINKVEWSDLDIYLNNKNCSYKKIISDNFYLVALTEEGRVHATTSNPSGLGVIPEHFIDIEDIFIKEEKIEDSEPYIIKEGKEIPLYVTNILL